MYSHVYRHKHLNTPENTLMQKLCKKCILSQGHIDVPLQGLKIVRVSAGDQHMGALTKEGKAGLLRCNKEVMPLCLRNFTWCLKSSCFVHPTFFVWCSSTHGATMILASLDFASAACELEHMHVQRQAVSLCRNAHSGAVKHHTRAD